MKFFKVSDRPESFTGIDLIREIIFCILFMVVAAGWVLMVELIISFMTVYYIKFKFKWMVIIAVICGILAGIYYIVKTIRKYRPVVAKKKESKAAATKEA